MCGTHMGAKDGSAHASHHHLRVGVTATLKLAGQVMATWRGRGFIYESNNRKIKMMAALKNNGNSCS